jgi:hypothetical protein
MKHESEFNQEEQQQAREQAGGQKVYEFETVEALLRHDALHTPVPPEIMHRLRDSIGPLQPPPTRSWWQRFFGQ